MFTFADFISHGILGNIEFGQSIDRYENLLGRPDGYSLHKKPLIYKYGILEIVFDFANIGKEKLLQGIFVYFSQIKYHKKPQVFNQYDWFPNDSTEPREVEKYLTLHNIAWEKNRSIDKNFIFETGICCCTDIVVDRYVIANSHVMSHIIFSNALLEKITVMSLFQRFEKRFQTRNENQKLK